MDLREALQTACSGGSVTPGAMNGCRYVYYDEESHGTSDRPWQYVPDVWSKNIVVYSLADDQLERDVLFASSQGWEPTSNLLIC